MMQKQGGMTLRDWFAGQALAGILAGAFLHLSKHNEPAVFADDAYTLADAMLAAREGGAS